LLKLAVVASVVAVGSTGVGFLWFVAAAIVSTCEQVLPGLYIVSLISFSFSIALIAIGSALVGLATGLMLIAHTFLAVLLLRALAGLGDALFYVLASTAVYTLTPDDLKASAQSRFTAVISAGILLGPVAAETLRPHVGYAGIWIMGAALATTACALVTRLPLPREPSPTNRPIVLERAAILPGVVIAAQTWALSAFTVLVTLYANHLGLPNADGPFIIVAVTVLTLRSIGAPVFERFESRTITAVAMVAATAGLTLLALLPDRRTLLVGSVLIAISQALALPALLNLAVHRAGVARRTSAVATFTGFFEAGLASSAIALGAALNEFGFRGLYGIAALVGAGALAPLLIARSNDGDCRVSSSDG
jgi:predicted MFS family arabinose efflux permease